MGRFASKRVSLSLSFENAISAAMAMGCSTNAIIHVIAIARRAGFDISLDDFDRIGRKSQLSLTLDQMAAHTLWKTFTMLVV